MTASYTWARIGWWPPETPNSGAHHKKRIGQPFPRVLPACDFAPFDEDGEVGVFPAFDSAALLGLPIALTSLPSNREYALPPKLAPTEGQCVVRRRSVAPGGMLSLWKPLTFARTSSVETS